MTNIVTDIGLKTWAGLRQCSVCLSQANHGERIAVFRQTAFYIGGGLNLRRNSL